MGRHSSIDFYHFCFFMTCLAKSRQEPLHFQNLLHWRNSLAAAQTSGSPWNIKEKHAQLLYHYKSLCPRVPIGACFARDRYNRLQKPLQSQGKGGSGMECWFSNPSFTLLPFEGLTGTFQTVWNTEAFEDWNPVSVLSIKGSMCLLPAKPIWPMPWVQPEASHPPQKLHFQTLLYYLWGAGLCTSEKLCCLASLWTLLHSFVWARWPIMRWNADKWSDLPLKVSTNKIIST